MERRQGVVTSVKPGLLVVRITQLSACSGCHAKDFCCSTDCKDHYLNIETSSEGFVPGDSVLVEGESAIGRMAVLLSFVLPLILLVISLVLGALVLQLSEPLTALVAVGALVLYYGILYLCNPRLKRLVRFGVHKIDK